MSEYSCNISVTLISQAVWCCSMENKLQTACNAHSCLLQMELACFLCHQGVGMQFADARNGRFDRFGSGTIRPDRECESEDSGQGGNSSRSATFDLCWRSVYLLLRFKDSCGFGERCSKFSNKNAGFRRRPKANLLFSTQVGFILGTKFALLTPHWLHMISQHSSKWAKNE